MDSQIYKLQNHSIIKVINKKFKQYNVLNRDNMLVATVSAHSRLNAVKIGRKYFGNSNVRLIN